MKEDFVKAFKRTFPCLFTYIFLGLAFGIGLSETGYGWIYSLLSSTFVFGGSIQLMMVEFLHAQEPLYIVAILTVVVNARYAFYGISFVNRTKNYEWYRKWYLVHTLSDEAYSILAATALPFERDTRRYEVFVCLQNHIYWIVGCVAGSIIGNALDPSLFEGFDFIMTALFTCVFVDQLRTAKTHLPMIIGLGSSILSLLVCNLIGFKYFILPSLVLSISLLFVFKKRISHKESLEYAFDR